MGRNHTALKLSALLLGCVVWLNVGTAMAVVEIRIKDITSVRGIRSNQLFGYGLVVGLSGTGDSLRNASFTEQSIQSMLDRMGVNVRNARQRTKNVAAVIVTAELPAFIGRGGSIDITISSLGDATSLAGGVLLLTPLQGPDKVIYAVAQGSVAIAGFQAQGKAESVTQGVPTTGRIPSGALVEKEVDGGVKEQTAVLLDLRNPDPTTVARIADAINTFTRQRYQSALAREEDIRSVRVRKPDGVPSTRFLAQIGELMVVPDTPARVVLDERTGTIIIGRDVRISPVAVAHGNLTVRVTETQKISRPEAFGNGETARVSETTVAAEQKGGHLAIVRGTSLQGLVGGLNAMGMKPVGIIAILQAIKSAGALQADLVMQWAVMGMRSLVFLLGFGVLGR